MTNATEYVTFGFSFRILVFFPSERLRLLNVTVCKRYEVFSVLAAIIRGKPWIEIDEGFAIHSFT